MDSVLLSPYPLKEHDEYSFEFITDYGVRYVLYFLDYSGMFAEYPEIARETSKIVFASQTITSQ